MNKEHILEQLKKGIHEGIVSKAEAHHCIDSVGDGEVSHNSSRTNVLTKVLYGIGGVVALSGVVSLLANNWDNISFVGKMLITLGFGLASYASAVILSRKTETARLGVAGSSPSMLSQIFFSISAPLIFIGAHVLYDKLFTEVLPDNAYDSYSSSIWNDNRLIVISLISFVIFAAALYAFKKKVLHVIATVFFTIAYFACISRIVDSLSISSDADYSIWRVIVDLSLYAWLVLGFAYIGYGYWIKTKSAFLNKAYYFFGFGSVLLSALFLSGVWNALYAFLVFGAIALSVRLRTTIGLVMSSVFTAVYCVKISEQYFADSFGFSFVLLFLGILLMALGYLTYYLNKKYISQQR